MVVLICLGGMTTLHVAVTRGTGLEDSPLDSSSGTSSEDGNPSSTFIQQLIHNGASVDSTTDHLQETPLHLAGRYQRADAARRLLEAGADPNARDIRGRTPLHTAIGADAQGVIHILCADRRTDLNARMNDGATPLILAVRLAIEGTTEELLQRDVDINAADDNGERIDSLLESVVTSQH